MQPWLINCPSHDGDHDDDDDDDDFDDIRDDRMMHDGSTSTSPCSRRQSSDDLLSSI